MGLPAAGHDAASCSIGEDQRRHRTACSFGNVSLIGLPLRILVREMISDLQRVLLRRRANLDCKFPKKPVVLQWCKALGSYYFRFVICIASTLLDTRGLFSNVVVSIFQESRDFTAGQLPIATEFQADFVFDPIP
jgi:hypothetical protein